MGSGPTRCDQAVRSQHRLGAKSNGAGKLNGAEGVHFLCLFDPATPTDVVQARIGACGVVSENEDSPLGDLNATSLLDKCPSWGMQCIATGGAQTELFGPALEPDRGAQSCEP
jgi:hypothetical protein